MPPLPGRFGLMGPGEYWGWLLYTFCVPASRPAAYDGVAEMIPSAAMATIAARAVRNCLSIVVSLLRCPRGARTVCTHRASADGGGCVPSVTKLVCAWHHL